jgi:hypothetical protein
MADLMMTRGEIEPYLIYPPGFHTLTAMISRLGGLEPLEIFPVLGPALLLLPALACYTLARGLWGWPYGVAAALLAGVLNGGTYYYFNDAMYPNLVTSQFLLVVVIAALTGFYDAPSPRRGLALALVGSSVVLYHPVASLYKAALLVLVSVYFLPYLLAHERAKGLAMLSSLVLLGSLRLGYLRPPADARRPHGLLGGEHHGYRRGHGGGDAGPLPTRLADRDSGHATGCVARFAWRAPRADRAAREARE